MRKQILLAVIGVGMVLTGCRSTKVMDKRGYKPAPVDDPAAEDVSMVQPETIQAKKTATPVAQKPLYEPMTDAKPTGGVDSAAASKISGKASAGKYVVKSGDFPARIARKCHVSVADLMAANNLTEESARKLRVGQVLVIPAGGKAVAAKSGKKTVKAAKKSGKVSAVPATESDGKYTVKPGDSPAKIAKRFHVKVSALMAANNLNESSAKSLQVGQKLIIPGKGQSVAPAVAPVVAPVAAPVAETAAPVAPVASPAADGSVAADTAAVAPDTAAAAPAAETAAISDNNTSAADGIEAVEVAADTTIAEYAAQNNIPLEKLRSINEGKDKLNKGDLLFVPKK